jgi:hypothetical protein
MLCENYGDNISQGDKNAIQKVGCQVIAKFAKRWKVDGYDYEMRGEMARQVNLYRLVELIGQMWWNREVQDKECKPFVKYEFTLLLNDLIQLDLPKFDGISSQLLNSTELQLLLRTNL